MERIVLIGAGGHSAAVLDAMLAAGGYEVAAIVGTPEEVGGSILGVPVLHTDAELEALAALGVAGFVVAVGSTGDSGTRRGLHARALAAGLTPTSVLHPSAIIASSATVEAGVFVGALAHVGPRSRVAEGAIVNTHASVDHDCVVGAFAHIAPGAVLSGGVVVGEGAHVGAGAVVSHGLRIGSGAIVGAGAVVVRDIADGVVAFGNPAVARREA